MTSVPATRLPVREAPSALHATLGDWVRRAIDAGWLPREAADALDDAVVATPGALFGDEERPLVAALFGGTGVGKSTLMNRLAGETVARASAERPTSREVTLYAHRALHVERLPDTLPAESVRTVLHGNARWRDVLWLDMPDVDSVERGNRALVERWLPHVDVLVYVVSPERYRDDEGWRLLLAHGERHAWLFVVNHWDRGDERQVEDFRALLVAAGLEDPLIFRTDSSGADEPPADDFAALETTLGALAERRVVERLEAHGVLARLRSLRERGEALRADLGDAAALAALEEDWRSHWSESAATLAESLGWRAESFAATRYADADAGWLARLAGRAAGARSPAAADDAVVASGTTALDETALARIDAAVARFAERTVARRALPQRVARRLFDATRARLAERLPSLVDDAVQHALAAPGTRSQRLAWRTCRALTALLPIAAMLWIGWRVVDAFARGADDPTAYLGGDFAINGALLLALAWLLPLALAARLRPSRERAAARGARAGIDRALEEVRLGVDATLESARTERAALDAAYAALWREDEPGTAMAGLPPTLRRMLFDGGAVYPRESGVRASTQSSTAAAPVS